MKVLHKIAESLIGRLALGRRDERGILESVLRQLPLATYWRLKEQGFAPGAIIDIGAHNGEWTRLIRSVFDKDSSSHD